MTGYVGKYLNGYEVRSRRQLLPQVPPGWSDFRAIFGTAYDGWDFQGTRTTSKGTTVLRSWPAPPPSASRKTRDRAYAGTVIGSLAMKFLRQRRGDPRPFFLQVAPYAPHGRVDDRPAYADESLFPAAFRDQPGGSRKRGDCGLVDCRDLTVKDLPGFGDRRGDNRPAARGRAQGLAVERPPADPHEVPGADQPARPGADGPVDRPAGAADPADGARRHVRGAHLRQRLPPRTAGTAARQGHRLRHRHARAPAGRRPRRRARGPRGDRQQHRPGADVRGPCGPRVAGVPVRDLAGADVRRSLDRLAGLRVLRAHQLEEPAGCRPRPRLHRRRLERDPVLRRRTQPHRPAGPQRPRPAVEQAPLRL